MVDFIYLFFCFIICYCCLVQPVRAELMQALWSTLHNPDDAVATVAFRVLGKFGGSNRKMLCTPQPVSGRQEVGRIKWGRIILCIQCYMK